MTRYRARAQMPAGYTDEAFYSLLRLGVLRLAEGDGLAYLLEAWQRCPHRWEPVHEACRWLNERRLLEASDALSKRALASPPRPSGLFAYPAVFDHLLLFEHSISAYWVGAYQESWDACQTLLAKGLPAYLEECVRRNMAFARQRLDERAPGRAEGGCPPPPLLRRRLAARGSFAALRRPNVAKVRRRWRSVPPSSSYYPGYRSYYGWGDYRSFYGGRYGRWEDPAD